MRARMALHQADIAVEIREVSLRNKPQHLLAVSPKGTVPVLVLPNQHVIEQSLDIMHWALRQRDAQGWLAVDGHDTTQLIHTNDTTFKQALDGYKYPERYPAFPATHFRQQGEAFLQGLEARLNAHAYLFGDQPSLADVAVFPFIRQFAAVDSEWFASAPYPQLQAWLSGWVNSALFERIMQKHPTYQDAI